MPPRLGLYSLADTPEELLSQGYGMVNTEFADDPAFGGLAYNTVYNPAPYTGAVPFQNVFRINEGQYYGDLDFPSFGGSSNINYNQFKPEEVATGIMKKAQPFEFLSSAYEDQDEDAEQDQEYIDQVNQSNNKFGGIMDLLMGIAIPGYGLFKNVAKGGLEGLRGFNQRLQQSDFGQSKNLMQYLGKRQAKKEAERLAPIQKQLREASERGGGYQPTTKSQNVARTSSRVSDGKTRAYGL